MTTHEIIDQKLQQISSDLLLPRAKLQDATQLASDLSAQVNRLSGAVLALNDLKQSLPTELPSNTQ